VVPFSYSQNNYRYNFVAACQICNGLKGSSMFATVEEARAYFVSLLEVQELPPFGPSGDGSQRTSLSNLKVERKSALLVSG